MVSQPGRVYLIFVLAGNSGTLNSRTNLPVEPAIYTNQPQPLVLVSLQVTVDGLVSPPAM